MTMTMTMHQERYLALRSLLLAYTPLWNGSILRDWARMEPLIPEDWFEWFRGATPRERQALECAPGALRDWSQALQEACRFPRREAAASFGPELVRGMTPKKRHEVEAIVSFVRIQPPRCASIVDVGGGAGYLARHLSRACGVPVHSVDPQWELQNSGRRQLERAPWRSDAKVAFHGARFGEWWRHAEPAAPVFTVGLHTCGTLAWEQLEWATESPHVHGLLNFGCCYELLDPAQGAQRSRFARSAPLEWSRDALFLSNRAGTGRTLDDLIFQQRVQAHRAGLYLWMSAEGFGERAEAVGSARDQAYRGPFSDYARDRLAAMGEPLPDPSRLEASYRRNDEAIRRRVFAGRLQNLLARPLEVLLLLDRAMWISERIPDARPELLELFDPRISPRNLGLFLLRHEGRAA